MALKKVSDSIVESNLQLFLRKEHKEVPCVWKMLHSLHVKDEFELLRMCNGFLEVVVGNPTLPRIYIIVFPWQSKFPPVDPNKFHYYHPDLLSEYPHIPLL